MARGSIAKEGIIKKLASAFGEDFIGEFDKKIYLWGMENGEKVQIALSLTCPKNPISVDKTIDTDMGDYDFSDDSSNFNVAVKDAPPAEITEEEKNNIAELMARLGL